MKSAIKTKINIRHLTLAGTILALLLAGFVAYDYRKLDSELSLVLEDNSTLLNELEEEKKENFELISLRDYQQSIIDSFQGQIQSIGQTVGTLEKLAATDEELLKKYSKVYFLNENYVPAKLTDITSQYLHNGTTNLLIHADVWPHLKRLLETALSDGVELVVASAFRSFDTQASLKSNYKVLYGSGANQFSADQGYSEHQLGTSVDFTTPAVGGIFSKFEADTGYKWLLDNAYRYGFILSYPKGNSYYKFEPWHWRFVGVALATHLHEEGKYFYDLDQREIDAYLVRLFD